MQRTTEWLDAVEAGYTDYHIRQFKTPYRSTVAFANWLHSLGLPKPNTAIADICCGAGAVLNYFCEQFPATSFTGIEISPTLVELGLSLKPHLNLVAGDMFNLESEHKDAYDGLLSVQILLAMPDFEGPLAAMCALNPKWIAATSLFYEGPVNCTIETRDYTLPLKDQPYKDAFYNIYSLPLVRDFLAGLGYPYFRFHKFEIDVDLPLPQNRGMGTYTQKLESGARLQFSGPLPMPWYFILASAQPPS